MNRRDVRWRMREQIADRLGGYHEAREYFRDCFSTRYPGLCAKYGINAGTSTDWIDARMKLTNEIGGEFFVCEPGVRQYDATKDAEFRLDCVLVTDDFEEAAKRCAEIIEKNGGGSAIVLKSLRMTVTIEDSKPKGGSSE